MSVKKKWYGKVAKHHLSWNIRHMLNDRNHFHDGTFGIYAGRKNLLKNGFKSVDEAVKYVDEVLILKIK